MTSPLEELARTVAKLDAVDERRASLVEYRDRQIRDALAAGSSWAEVREVARLSLSGLAKAIKRV